MSSGPCRPLDPPKAKRGISGSITVMAAADGLGAFWLYQAPNLLLAALMYTLLGRFLLSLFYPDTSDKVLWRVFRQITQPVIEAVRVVTPLVVPPPVVILFAVAWVFLARLMLFLGFAAAGYLPVLEGMRPS
jgi:YggT family protein